MNFSLFWVSSGGPRNKTYIVTFQTLYSKRGRHLKLPMQIVWLLLSSPMYFHTLVMSINLPKKKKANPVIGRDTPQPCSSQKLKQPYKLDVAFLATFSFHFLFLSLGEIK